MHCHLPVVLSRNPIPTSPFGTVVSHGITRAVYVLTAMFFIRARMFWSCAGLERNETPFASTIVALPWLRHDQSAATIGVWVGMPDSCPWMVTMSDCTVVMSDWSAFAARSVTRFVTSLSACVWVVLAFPARS